MLYRISSVDIIESLSDSQIAEMGLRWWNRSKDCHASSAFVFIEAASKCDKELQRRAEFRKVNKDTP